MNDRRPLSELLQDEALYEAGAPAPPGSAWRERLLAARFSRASRAIRSPRAGMAPAMRLILLVAVPLVAILAITLASSLDHGPFVNALDTLSHQDWAKRSLFAGEPAPGHGDIEPSPGGLPASWIGFQAVLWPFLVAASAGLTFLVRRRMPRLLPLDW